jgi:hypothetical protein
MCSCLEETNKILAKDNTEITFMFYLMGNKQPKALIQTQKRNPKIKGAPKRIAATFCPFCGERYDQTQEEKE